MYARVCVARAILISYLCIQYDFSAASRQTEANRRKNVFVVDALIYGSVSRLSAISVKYYHSGIFILSKIFSSRIPADDERGVIYSQLRLLNAVPHAKFAKL